jgi:error-prone DNA polymerase
MGYAELHCHSYYSFHDGASSLEELIIRAKELGYRALAITDHDNLCGAMRFAQLARSLDIQGIIGAEVTLRGGYHLTLLAEDSQGYRNLCRLITAALSGCPQGELSQMVANSRFSEARSLIGQCIEWFGRDNYYLELQQNLVFDDTERNKGLLAIAKEVGARVVATGNVHYHIRERHQLQDCLVAIKHCKSLEETHQERRPNSEFYLRPWQELESLFRECPEALTNTVKIADRCSLNLTNDLSGGVYAGELPGEAVL